MNSWLTWLLLLLLIGVAGYLLWRCHKDDNSLLRDNWKDNDHDQ